MRRLLMVLGASIATLAGAQNCPPPQIVKSDLGDAPAFYFPYYSTQQLTSGTIIYKWIAQALDDPSRNMASSTVVGSVERGVSITVSKPVLAGNCNMQLVPFELVNAGSLGTWPTSPSTYNGFYKLYAYFKDMNGSIIYSYNYVYVFCRSGVWSFDTPGNDPGWSTLNTGEYSDGTQPDQSLKINLFRNGLVPNYGATVTLRRNDGAQSTQHFANGQAVFKPVNPGPYTLILGGSSIEQGTTVYYSGQVPIVKPDGIYTANIYVNINGQYESMNDGSGSTGGGSDEQPSWIEGFMNSLFVPQQETVDSVKQSIDDMTTWGPFGPLQQLLTLDQNAAAEPSVFNLPTYTGNGETGWEPCQTCTLDMSTITDNDSMTLLRSWLGIGVYLGVVGGLVHKLWPRQVM